MPNAMMPYWIIVPDAEPAVANEKAAEFMQRVIPLVKPPYKILRHVAWAATWKLPSKGAVSSVMMVEMPDQKPEPMYAAIRAAMKEANTVEPKVKFALGSEPNTRDFME